VKIYVYNLDPRGSYRRMDSFMSRLLCHLLKALCTLHWVVFRVSLNHLKKMENSLTYFYFISNPWVVLYLASL
jgi:hypothetical protein